MVSNTEPATWDTPSRITGEWVTVERAIERKKEDVIATLEITATGDVPVSVEVVDEFPEEWSVLEVGVHPEFKPATVVAESNRFEFADTVGPGSPVEVVYGARIDAPETTAPPNSPIIQRERPLKLGSHIADDDAEEDRGESLRDAVEDAELEFVDGTPPLLGDPPTGGDVDTAVELEERAYPFTRASSLEEDAGPLSVDGGEASAVDADLLVGASDEDSLVEALAEELTAERAPEEAVSKLKDTFGASESKRDAVRVDHLQSRMEEFAAYADALGDLLDEYGSLDGVFDDLQSRLEAVEGEVDDVRTEVDTAETERASVRERVDAVGERIDSVEGLVEDLESVPDELDRLRDDHGEAIDDLEAGLEAHESSVSGAIQRLEADLDGLEDEVGSWDATRRQLADVLRPESAPDRAPDEAPDEAV